MGKKPYSNTYIPAWIRNALESGNHQRIIEHMQYLHHNKNVAEKGRELEQRRSRILRKKLHELTGDTYSFAKGTGTLLVSKGEVTDEGDTSLTGESSPSGRLVVSNTD